MSNAAPSQTPRIVIVWLAVVLAMIAAIVVVGGLTRLTQSGLSITEWKPVTGALPPLSDADWQAEFSRYQATTQYQVMNRGMTLAAFQTIYWWEWGHRLLARTIGLVVLIPLLLFWWRGTLAGPALRRGGILFGLICAQGALGWFMVVSGLEGRTSVSQYRLAAHLGLAFVVFGWTLWMLLDLRRPRTAERPAHGYGLAITLLVLVACQVLFGALVAGLDAGLAYNTWPLMDGQVVPGGLMAETPWWANFGENVAMVQFQHRLTAYAVAALALAVFATSRAGRPGRGTAVAVLAVTLAQIALGITTLLAGAGGIQPIALGAMHQLGALCLVAAAIVHLHRVSPGRQRMAQSRPAAAAMAAGG